MVIGVWHGAGWAFCYLWIDTRFAHYVGAFYRETSCCYPEKGAKVLSFKTVMVVRTYFFFALSLLFFRIVDVDKVMYVYTHAFNLTNANIKDLKLGLADQEWLVFAVAVVIMFLLDHFNAKKDLITSLRNTSPIWRWVIYFAIIIAIFRFGSFGVENFIYVQF